MVFLQNKKGIVTFCCYYIPILNPGDDFWKCARFGLDGPQLFASTYIYSSQSLLEMPHAIFGILRVSSSSAFFFVRSYPL